MRYNMEVVHMWQLLVKSCELVEVRSKETECVNLGCNVSMYTVQDCKIGGWIVALLRDCPGKPESVVSGSSCKIR